MKFIRIGDQFVNVDRIAYVDFRDGLDNAKVFFSAVAESEQESQVSSEFMRLDTQAASALFSFLQEAEGTEIVVEGMVVASDDTAQFQDSPKGVNSAQNNDHATATVPNDYELVQDEVSQEAQATEAEEWTDAAEQIAEPQTTPTDDFTEIVEDQPIAVAPVQTAPAVADDEQSNDASSNEDNYVFARKSRFIDRG